MIRVLAIAAFLAFPAGAAARAWQPPRLLAASGYDPAAAIGHRDGVGVAYASHSRGRYAVTLRRGTGALSAAKTVFRGPAALDSARVTFQSGTGIAVVAWRELDGTWRLRLRRVEPSLALLRVVDVAGEGNSVLFPFFVPGSLHLIAWGRRSGAGASTYVGSVLSLPAGPTTSLALAENPADGTVTAVWPQHGVLYAASTAPGTRVFGAPAAISPPGGYARDPQLVAGGHGNMLAVWLDSHGQGNALLAAGRPPSGTFGRAFQVERSSYGVTSPQATLAGDGRFLVTFVSTRRSLPIAHFRGTVRLGVLDAAGRRVAPVVTINPVGAPATEISASAQEVAWASGHRIVTRQLAGSGRLGAVQTVRAHGAPVELSLAANSTGRAVLAYVDGGAVYGAVRR